MKLPRLGVADTILGRTLILLLGIAVLLTAINVSIILSRPPPRDAPLSTFEIARLLKGQPIAKSHSNVQLQRVAQPPAFHARTRLDQLGEIALAHQLGTPVANVRFKEIGKLPSHVAFMPAEVERAYGLYGPDRMEVPAPHGFRAAVRLPDGQWQVASRQNVDELANWRSSIITRFIISLALMLPIAWLFARWLAGPIHKFADAAERLGRERQVENVDASGPVEVRQAAEALNVMQDRIRRYVLERTAVVGAIAHDLRTPLARLKFHLAEAPDATRGRAEGEIDEMEQMIAAALEFAHAEARPRQSERVDLALLVEGVVDDLTDLGRDVTLTGSEHATVVGDPLLLKRMFTNLVNNAVTYGRRANVTVERNGSSGIVRIDDEGPGLDPASLARAFEPFYRAETSRNRATGGMGLGLAIVKFAANSHGGDVTLANRPEGGLRAEVRLPIEQA